MDNAMLHCLPFYRTEAKIPLPCCHIWSQSLRNRDESRLGTVHPLIWYVRPLDPPLSPHTKDQSSGMSSLWKIKLTSVQRT